MKRRYVWCAEDEKYGLLAVYATKKAADKDYGPKAKQWNWIGGQGGSVVKRIVNRSAERK
jgi:hypothetical protein